MLQIRNVTIRSKKDDRLLADDLSFTLHKGERAAFIGEEGNGKSTLLKWRNNLGSRYLGTGKLVNYHNAAY